MKNIVLKTCLTALAFSVAGLANAQDAGEPVKIFTEQLTSHAAISAAAISISADSFVDGHIASQAAATTGAGSEVQNIVSGAATGIGAAAKTCDIYAGAAIAVGAGSTVGVLSAGGAVTLGALTQSDVICDSAPAVVTSDFDAANAQIKSAQSALDTIPASSLVDAYTLVGNMDTGVYEGAAITIPANTLITFDANGQDGVWIFNLSGAMTVGAGSEFEIINAGDNNAVIWNIGGALTLGAGSTFLGTAFVEGAVSGATASVSCGNLYATGAISIGSIGSIGGDDCKVAADMLADFAIKDGSYSFAPLEAVLAIAYINRDGLPGFDAAAGDILISKLLDTNLDGTSSVGDTVVTSQFPTDLNASGVGNFSLNTFQVTHIRQSGAENIHLQSGIRLFGWVSQLNNCKDHYVEMPDYRGIYAAWTIIVDGSCGWGDKVSIRTGSPSLPVLPVDILMFEPWHSPASLSDDDFLEVDIFFDVSFP
ncbi:MAG: hypothetical protein ACJAXJ_001860 [Colwellia sp.]|jgi:hypothetical protein